MLSRNQSESFIENANGPLNDLKTPPTLVFTHYTQTDNVFYPGDYDLWLLCWLPFSASYMHICTAYSALIWAYSLQLTWHTEVPDNTIQIFISKFVQSNKLQWNFIVTNNEVSDSYCVTVCMLYTMLYTMLYMSTWRNWSSYIGLVAATYIILDNKPVKHNFPSTITHVLIAKIPNIQERKGGLLT